MTAPQQMPPQHPAQGQYGMPQAGPQPRGPVPTRGQAPGFAPVPEARANFGHALVSEWTKIRSVRSTVWTLGVMFVLVVGIGFLTALGLSGGTYTGMPILSTGLFGLMLGQICVITLGVLVVTSEYGTGMIRATFTACPRRGRVLLAKSTVFFLLAFVMTTAACTITAVVNSVMLAEQDLPAGAAQALGDSVRNGRIVADSGEWLGATVGAGLYVALLGLLSLAVGALLRHSAGAITTMMGLVLLPLVISLFMNGEVLEPIRDVLMEYSPLNGLASLYSIPMSNDPEGSGWPLLGVLAGVTAAVLAGAYGLLRKRDV